MEFLAISRTITHDYSIRCSFRYPITCTKFGTSSPLLPKKPQQNKQYKSSVIHIFFSYLFIKSLEKSNSRTVGSVLPNCRYRTPELSVPKSRTVAYTNSRNVAVPNCRATIWNICFYIHPALQKDHTYKSNTNQYI